MYSMRITSHPYSAVNSAGGRLARTQTINALRRGYTQKRERKNTALRRRRGRAGSAANAGQIAEESEEDLARAATDMWRFNSIDK